jgi:hypothetical protein
MFCAPGLIFDGIEVVGSRFLILRSWTHFGWYRGSRVPFSCFTLPDSFWAVPRAPGPVFLFCAPGLILDGIEGAGSRFYVLRSRTHFRRYRGRRVPFSCFARYRGSRVPFSSFVLPNSFWAAPRESGPVFMFCAPGLVFDGTEGVGSRFHFLAPILVSGVQRASGPVFMFCTPKLILGCTESVGSNFHILRSRTRIRRNRGRRVPFSCFALPNSFSAVSWASVLVFIFCAPGLYFGGTEVVGSRFHFLRSRIHFRRY